MKKEYPKEYYQKTSHEQVVFKDGMIVTAEHLQAAVQYPISVFQTLIRAFFGCGIVCGLKVEMIAGTTTCEHDSTKQKKNVWCIKVNPGVALDCQGYPIELCKEITIDLTPDPCSIECPPECICIAIRRYEGEEPQPKSNCNGNEIQQSPDCSRKREQVLVKVFDCEQLPKNICMLPCEKVAQAPPYKNSSEATQYNQTLNKIICDCLTTCTDCQCGGEGWVLLACIEMDECGIECIDHSKRKYVKPIHCLCPPEQNERDESAKTKDQPHQPKSATPEYTEKSPPQTERTENKDKTESVTATKAKPPAEAKKPAPRGKNK